MAMTVHVPVLPRCDICWQETGEETPANYDAKTKMGPWANMCIGHFLDFGMGLGTGLGQRLIPPDREGAQ